MSSSARRLRRTLAAVLAVGVAYGAGVVTGVLGSHPVSTGGVIDEAAARIAAEAARPVDRARLERAAVQGMLSALDDQWSSYYSPSQYDSFQQSLQGRYSGVGLWLRPGPAGVVVSSARPGSPAAGAGVRAGDMVVAVDGRSVATASVGQVVALLRGRDGTEVTLTLARAGAPLTVRLTRATLTTQDVTVDHLRGGMMVIKVAAFTRGVGRQVRDALAGDPAGFAGGVILDLRGNPGGLLDEAVEVASAFLDSGVVVSYERRDLGRQTLDVVGTGDTRTPLVVLVDGATASAAEVVAAALQDHNRAVVVGSRTFGKGSVQEPTRLSDGSAIEFTVGRYLTPNGRVIDGHGVEPDVVVDPGMPPQVAEQRAIEVLRGLMAALSYGRG